MTRLGRAAALMRRYALLFWDFDGVIKESVELKGEAFGRLFAACGEELVTRVRAHHAENGGMSRLEKIPLYLRWAGIEPSEAEVARYCAVFAASVEQAVIDAPWVPGAREYLERHRARQRFVLLTATPQSEISAILRRMQIGEWFCDVHGAPTTKRQAIGAVLERCGCMPREALLIGDSDADFESARAAGIDFLLRQTALNRTLQRRFPGPQCENFLDE